MYLNMRPIDQKKLSTWVYENFKDESQFSFLYLYFLNYVQKQVLLFHDPLVPELTLKRVVKSM